MTWIEGILPRVADTWWNDCVLNSLSYTQREIAKSKGFSKLSDFDLAALLRIANKSWYDMRTVAYLPSSEREVIREMMNVRNNWAHCSAELPGKDDVQKDLHTVLAFISQVGGDEQIQRDIEAFITYVERPDSIKNNTHTNEPIRTAEQTSAPVSNGEIRVNSLVRLVGSPEVQGVVRSIRNLETVTKYDVFVNGVLCNYYTGQIELVEETGGYDWVSVNTVRSYLTAYQINNPSSQNLYSLNSARIDFVPYQFRPALKIIHADEPRLLIADKHIIPSIGKIKLNKLQQSDLQKFYAELKKSGRIAHVDLYGAGLSDRMVRSCHTTCRTALQKAVDEGLIHQNPAIGCKLPPKKAREMQVLTHEEMKRFLIQAKEDGFFEMAALELATGMRRGEICALKWEDMNFDNGELHISRQAYHVKGELRISKPKTKSSDRIIILPESVLNVLQKLKEQTKSEWMFESPVIENQPYDPQSIYGKMKKVLKRAQCKNVRFHDLRHTFATTALEHGMDIKTLSAIIGHISSATTIDIYSHVTDTMQRQAATRIEDGFGNGEAFEANEATEEGADTDGPQEAVIKAFEPYKGKVRKSGTGGIYEINDHLFEGRYTPTNAHGKREAHNVYAKTKEKCAELLNAMIEQVRAQIAEEKAAIKAAAESAEGQ